MYIRKNIVKNYFFVPLFDAFAAHLTDDVESQLLEAKTNTLTIPAGCTSQCQPMDVCLNKPFKAIL